MAATLPSFMSGSGYYFKPDYILVMSHFMANFSTTTENNSESSVDDQSNNLTAESMKIETTADKFNVSTNEYQFAASNNNTNGREIIGEAICQIIIMSLSIIGNALVILSLCMLGSRLRGKKNVIFVLSLASADFLVAVCVMPFHILENVIGYWPFGDTFCNIFTANDVFFCTASLLGIICIAIERYVAVFKPLRYTSLMTTRVAISMVCIAWVLSLLVSYIPIHLNWHKHSIFENSQNYNDTTGALVVPNTCGFDVNPTYAVSSSLVSFWVPTAIMIFVYARMYVAAKRQLTALQRGSSIMLTTPAITQLNGNNNNNDKNRANKERRYSSHRHSVEKINFVAVRRKSSLGALQERSLVGSLKRFPSFGSNKSSTSRTPSTYSASFHLRTEVTLGRILGCFVICWFPFFTLLVVDSAILETPLDPEKFGWLFKSVLWLGYMNSAANPLIYAISIPEFKPFWVRLQPACRNNENCCCFNGSTSRTSSSSKIGNKTNNLSPIFGSVNNCHQHFDENNNNGNESNCPNTATINITSNNNNDDSSVKAMIYSCGSSNNSESPKHEEASPLPLPNVP